MTFRRSVAAAALLGAAVGAAAQEAPTATPYRPSVSTPAALSAPGWLEIEAGLDRDNGPAGARRDSLPYTFKFAFSPDWGIRVGGEALVTQRDDRGGRISGAGDLGVVIKRRFAIDDQSAFGLEGGVSLPTGRRGISAGKPDTTVNGIYSADIGQWHTDINLAFTRVGAIGEGEGRTQALWAASLSHPLDERWGLVGELSGTHRHNADHTTQALVAASYNVSSALVLDFGTARSMRSGPAQWSVFGGFTWLAARLL
jgi:hypothetical protein